MANLIEKDLGAVSAYAYAVEQGYKGTEEQFAKEQAGFAQNAQQVATDKDTVVNAVNGFNKKVADANNAIDKAKTESVGAITAEGTTQVNAVKQEGATQKKTVADAVNGIVADREQINQNKNDILLVKSNYLELNEHEAYLELKLENGLIGTDMTITNDNLSAYKHTKIAVQSKEKYKVTCCSSNPTYSGAFAYNSVTKQFTVLLEGVYVEYVEKEIIIPDGCDELYLNTYYQYTSHPLKAIKIEKNTSENFWKDYDKNLKVINNTVSRLKNKKVINFGDSIFGNFNDLDGEKMSISAMMSKMTGADCHNVGFGGCRMVYHPTPNFDKFSMAKLADAIASGDWSAQLTAGAEIGGDYKEKAMYLSTLDWSTVDIITVAYGTNDFFGNIRVSDYENEISTIVQKILTKYPHIQIMFISPCYRTFLNKQYEIIGDSDDFVIEPLNQKLTDFVNACERSCKKNHLPYCDNYYNLGFNKFNRLIYFSETDMTHPNKLGRKILANHIISKLMETFN